MEVVKKNCSSYCMEKSVIRDTFFKFRDFSELLFDYIGVKYLGKNEEQEKIESYLHESHVISLYR